MGLCVDKLKLYLEGSVTEKTCKLCFGNYLFGHQIEKKYLKGTDILSHSSRLRHYEDILVLKNRCCGKKVWYFNRQNIASFIG